MLKQVVLFMCIGVLSVSALTKGELKKAILAHKVCEKKDGYVKPLQKDPYVDSLVQEVNMNRAQVYKGIASTRGVSDDVIAQESGAERYGKHPDRFCQ